MPLKLALGTAAIGLALLFGYAATKAYQDQLSPPPLEPSLPGAMSVNPIP